MEVGGPRHEAARIIANATLAVRQAALWGEETTAMASDSTHMTPYGEIHLRTDRRLDLTDLPTI